MKKYTIWQNYDVDPADWKEYLDDIGIDDPDSYEAWDVVQELNWEYLDDERMNLDAELPSEILIIGDLGCWNGRVRMAWKELNSNNLADVLRLERDCDYAEFYVDRYKNVRSRQTHHDGTNYLLYRRWKDGISDIQRENFLEKMYSGTATEKDITRYTSRLGDDVCRVYGWN